MSFVFYSSFKEFLEIQFKQRVAKNASYSLRAFARDIGLSPAHLSRFLHDKRGISAANTTRILTFFDLPAAQKEYLEGLVHGAGNSEQKKREPITSDMIKAVMAMPGFKFDLKWIADKLQTDIETAAVAVVGQLSQENHSPNSTLLEIQADPSLLAKERQQLEALTQHFIQALYSEFGESVAVKLNEQEIARAVMKKVSI